MITYLLKYVISKPTWRSIMQKPFLTAVLLAATLGLAACDSEPQDKTDSAKESLSDAAQSVKEAAKENKGSHEQQDEQMKGGRKGANEGGKEEIGERVEDKQEHGGGTQGEIGENLGGRERG